MAITKKSEKEKDFLGDSRLDYKTKEVSKKKRLKTFLTTFTTQDGVYSWEIKAYDFDEAEAICKRINHKLDGKKIKV